MPKVQFNAREHASMGCPDWLAVQTKPSRESRVASCLRALNLEVLLPRVRSRRSRNRVTNKAFFPNYLFTLVTDWSAELQRIQYCQGVVRVVNSRGRPVPVDPEIIDSIRSIMDDQGFVKMDTPPLQQGERIRIEEGPLRGWFGELERELDGGKRVAILLDAILTLNARVVVERCHISVNAEN